MNVRVFAHPTISPRRAFAQARPGRARRCGALALAVLLAFTLADGAFAASKKTRNTLIGAGIGAAAGAMLSNGDTWGTIGGAAAGGLIGNAVTKDRHHRRDRRDWDRRHDRDWRYDRDRRYDRRRDWDRRR